MNPVLVVGSVALDTVETPAARQDEVLGGSATYFSIAAHRFAPVRLVGIVGEDFPAKHRELFRARQIDLEGLQVGPKPTFRWHGRYDAALQGRATLKVDLEILEHFRPTLPDAYRDSKIVLLGNTSPNTQATVLSQLKTPAFVMLDTMNIWIQTEREALWRLLPKIDALCVNHEEASMLAETPNLARAVRVLLGAGLRHLIVKRAEHGATLYAKDYAFSVPAYPTEHVVDPTGAGDSFAGGFLGWIAKTGTAPGDLRRALICASVMGSLAVESFGPDRSATAPDSEVERRRAELVGMISL